MSGIILGLVDNQFIHGEIGLRWCTVTDSELVIIVDDKLAKDKLRQGLMDMQIIDTITARYYSVEKAIEKLPMINQKDKNSIVIFNSLNDLFKVVDGGIHLNNIVLSSVPHNTGDKMITHSVSLSNAEITQLKKYQEQKSRIVINSDPDTKMIPFDEI